MGRKPTGRPTGRPPREFDDKIFEGLCQILCTFSEMNSIFKCDTRTLSAWCSRVYGEDLTEVYKRFSSEGKASLRRNQFKLSAKNATMAIWLGKQWLGQSDYPNTENQFDGSLKLLLDTLKTKIKGPDDFNIKRSSSYDEEKCLQKV